MSPLVHAQVTVKVHVDKDDDEGERVDGARLQAASNHRLYKPVPADMLIRVTLRNLSANPLSFRPVFVEEDGTEEVGEKIHLESGEVREHAGRAG